MASLLRLLANINICSSKANQKDVHEQKPWKGSCGCSGNIDLESPAISNLTQT